MTLRPEALYRAHFAAALVDRSSDAHPPDLDARAARRFRVYRNNVHGALIGALGDAYPVVRRLVGEDFFAAMAREFFLSETVRRPSLALYGAGFADFIDRFEPASGRCFRTSKSSGCPMCESAFKAYTDSGTHRPIIR